MTRMHRNALPTNRPNGRPTGRPTLPLPLVWLLLPALWQVLALPTTKICPQYNHINKLEDLNPLTLQTISHFFEHYKDLEKGKWVKVLGWEGLEEATKEITDGVAN